MNFSLFSIAPLASLFALALAPALAHANDYELAKCKIAGSGMVRVWGDSEKKTGRHITLYGDGKTMTLDVPKIVQLTHDQALSHDEPSEYLEEIQTLEFDYAEDYRGGINTDSMMGLIVYYNQKNEIVSQYTYNVVGSDKCDAVAPASAK